MVAFPSSTLVSKCCDALIMLDSRKQRDYECTMCGKPCESNGTLGELYERRKAQAAPSAKQRLGESE